AANALDEDPDGIFALGGDSALASGHVHVSSVAAQGSISAHGQVDAAGASTAESHGGGDGAAAIAPAAADRLRQHPRGMVTPRRDVPRKSHFHAVSRSSAGAVASQTERDGGGQTGAGAHGSRHGETAVAAAAAAALGEEADGAIALRLDTALVAELLNAAVCEKTAGLHPAPIAPRTAIATDGQGQGARDGLARRDGDRNGVAAVAAATTHALQQDARGVLARGVDDGEIGAAFEGDETSVSARASLSSDRHRGGHSIAAGDGQGAAPPAPDHANGLGENADRPGALGPDERGRAPNEPLRPA